MLDSEEYRAKLRGIKLFTKDAERVLHHLLGAEQHIFPEDLHRELDAFHWADYLQCTAKCTACDVPCFTSAIFSLHDRHESALPKTKAEKKERQHHRRKNFPSSMKNEKLIQELHIGQFTTMSLMDKMGLKCTVCVALFCDVGKHAT